MFGYKCKLSTTVSSLTDSLEGPVLEAIPKLKNLGNWKGEGEGEGEGEGRGWFDDTHFIFLMRCADLEEKLETNLGHHQWQQEQEEHHNTHSLEHGISAIVGTKVELQEKGRRWGC